MIEKNEMTLSEALKGTAAESFVKMVKLELQDIKKTFVKIGFRLSEAQQFGYYKELGYETIEELSEAEFDLKRTSTYNLILIARSFCSGMELKDEYKCFSYSQLIVMTKMLTYLVEPCSRCYSEYTVLQFNEYYNYLRKGGVLNMKDYFNYKQLEMDATIVPQLEEPKVKETLPLIDEIDSKSQTEKTEEKSLEEKLIDYFGTYKTIFDPDNKGLGVRVVPKELAEGVLDIVGDKKVEEKIQTFGQDKEKKVPRKIYDFSKDSDIDRFLFETYQWDSGDCVSPYFSHRYYRFRNGVVLHCYVYRAGDRGVDSMYSVHDHFYMDSRWSDVPVLLTREQVKQYLLDNRDKL